MLLCVLCMSICVGFRLCSRCGVVIDTSREKSVTRRIVESEWSDLLIRIRTGAFKVPGSAL